MNKLFITTILIITLFACNKAPDSQYVNSVKEFHKTRIEKLKQPDSWLSLIGLYWLEKGENSFGTDKENKIVFPEKLGYKNAGIFILNDSTVNLKVNNGVKIFNDTSLVSSIKLENDLTGNPTILRSGSLSWYVIKRGNKFGIRLKDSEAPLLKEFTDIEMFDIDSSWRVPATFLKYEKPKDVLTPTAIGTFEKSKVFGKLTFTLKGEKLSLEPSISEDGYFVVFGDLSNGEETYGAGRFLFIPKPDSGKQLFIDFNRAYNPPCVFTKYATCPLPRKENSLKIKILAGEKNYHSKYH